jgi:hypothetical protein
MKPFEPLSMFVLGGLLALAACSDGGGELPGDATPPPDVPPRPAYHEWIKVEPAGAVCGNGSQYKFFVNFSDSSNDVVVYMEPGGGCWDYSSCTGQEDLGAANLNGLPDDHYSFGQLIAPVFNRDRLDNYTRDWNMVFVPYCTADVHTGNSVITYSDPTGVGEDVVFHHTGHDNVQAVIEWMAGEFPAIPRLLLSGCSAGGAGSSINYYYFRTGLPQIDRGYLLSDSGPIFPSGGNSAQLHAKVRESWNVDPLLEALPLSFDQDDFGSINTLLAAEFPQDRLAVTYFRRDYNYSRYSYERFFDSPPKEEVLGLWWEDTQLLTALFDQHDNLAYYIPYWRDFNDSHCTTVVTYAGAEIQEAGMTMEKYIELLMDDGALLQSYLESQQPGEDAN